MNRLELTGAEVDEQERYKKIAMDPERRLDGGCPVPRIGARWIWMRASNRKAEFLILVLFLPGFGKLAGGLDRHPGRLGLLPG